MAKNKKQLTYVVIDIETTGLNINPAISEKIDHILEVAAVKMVKGKIVETYHSYCDCPILIPQSITTLTGISNEDLTGAPSVEKVLKELSSFCKDCKIIGHNVDFDLAFLNYYGEQYGVSFSGAYEDTYLLSKYYLKDELKSFKLSKLTDYFKLKYISHRALKDAIVTAKVFNKLQKICKHKQGKSKRHCRVCKQKCDLYKVDLIEFESIPPVLYRKVVKWVSGKNRVDILDLQKEFNICFTLASKMLDKLKLDAIIDCKNN